MLHCWRVLSLLCAGGEDWLCQLLKDFSQACPEDLSVPTEVGEMAELVWAFRWASIIPNIPWKPSSPIPLPGIKRTDDICSVTSTFLSPPGLPASRTAVSYSRRAYILPSLWIFLPWLHRVPKGGQRSYGSSSGSLFTGGWERFSRCSGGKRLHPGTCPSRAACPR